MTAPVIVAIQRSDKFRLFRANGRGATEIGYLATGPIPDDAAVALALGITQLLDSAALPVETRESGGSATPALSQGGAAAAVLPPGTTYTGDNKGTGQLVAANPGLTNRELAALLGVHPATMGKRLTRATQAGTVKRKGRRYYPPTTRAVSTSPNKRGSTATTGVSTKDFVAYVRAHPGLHRDEVARQLGYTIRQTIHNRVAIGRQWGAITVDNEGRVWPTTEPGQTADDD